MKKKTSLKNKKLDVSFANKNISKHIIQYGKAYYATLSSIYKNFIKKLTATLFFVSFFLSIVVDIKYFGYRNIYDKGNATEDFFEKILFFILISVTIILLVITTKFVYDKLTAAYKRLALVLYCACFYMILSPTSLKNYHWFYEVVFHILYTALMSLIPLICIHIIKWVLDGFTEKK